MLLTIKNPEKVFLIQGNHDLNRHAIKGFFYELESKYPQQSSDLKPKFDKAFKRLPQALLIGNKLGAKNNYVFCCHGMLPYYSDPIEKDLLKTNLATCATQNNCNAIFSQAKEAIKTSTFSVFSYGRLLLKGERVIRVEPLIDISEFTPDYLKSISSPDCTIISVLCGHNHFYPPIAIASPDFTSWVPLKNSTSVIDHAVYIFTSAPEALGGSYLGSKDITYSKGGFGILDFNDNPQKWVLTPYPNETTIKPGEKKFTHISPSGKFSYHDTPQADFELKESLK